MQSTVPIFSRRSFIAGVTSLFSFFPPAFSQQKWNPEHPVRLIVPFPPGGGSDVLARLLSDALKEQLPQPLVIENRPGASGTVGTQMIYQAKNDGYSLLLGTMDTHAIAPHVGKVSFNSLAMPTAGGVARTSFVLMGRPNIQAEKLAALIQFGQTNELTYASAGNGTSLHIAMALFADRAKLKTPLHIPFQGVAPALQALLASQVDLMFVPLVNVPQYFDRLRAYAISSFDRHPSFPSIGTFREGGVDCVVESWFAIFAPPGTDDKILDTLHRAIQSVLGMETVKERLQTLGLTPDKSSRADFARFHISEFNRWFQVVRSNHLVQD